MESEPEIAPAPRMESAMDDQGNETIDLETLDLGEEPMVINAEPEQGQEAEDLQDAEEVLELDEEPPQRQPRRPRRSSRTRWIWRPLAAEAEELEDDVRSAPVVEDLEIGELETLSDEATGPGHPTEGDRDRLRRGPCGGRGDACGCPDAELASAIEEIHDAEEISRPAAAPVRPPRETFPTT